jgi:hypothetical protein
VVIVEPGFSQPFIANTSQLTRAFGLVAYPLGPQSRPLIRNLLCCTHSISSLSLALCFPS